jgi:hypothetical protein
LIENHAVNGARQFFPRKGVKMGRKILPDHARTPVEILPAGKVDPHIYTNAEALLRRDAFDTY